MRDIVRAAGRLDWKAKSDPVWHGVKDVDPPDRVLDVKALTGGDLLRTWIFHDRFAVGRSVTSRATRVDVQRGGGYGGTATLSLGGLPGEVGSASFGKSALAGMGRKALGTRLRLTLKASGPDGLYPLDVSSDGPGVSRHSRELGLKVDRTGPEVNGLDVRIKGGKVTLAASGAAQAVLGWTVNDQLSEVRSAQLQRRTDGSSWRAAGGGGTSSSRVTLKPGQANKFRVKARDALGNVRHSASIWARLSVRDSGSSRWQKPASGGWQTKKVGKAFGGAILLAQGPTDSLSTTFNGKAAAIVASIGPGRGSCRVRIDGGAWHTVDLKSNRAGHRRVVWSRRLVEGSHSLEIQGSDGQTALDALLVVR
jgi:hypothetical protein